MTLEEATRIVDELPGCWGWNYEPGDTSVCVDGWFTPEQLEALAMVLRADATVGARTP